MFCRLSSDGADTKFCRQTVSNPETLEKFSFIMTKEIL